SPSLHPTSLFFLAPSVLLPPHFPQFICNQGTVFTLKTDLDACRYRLINIDITKPDKADWTTLVPEHDKDVLEWAACVNQTRLVLCYLRDVKSVLLLHKLEDGSFVQNFPLDMGSVTGYSGRKKDTEIFYSFTSFLTPGIIYHCDMAGEGLRPSVFREIEVKGFDGSLYETHQVFYPSKDGTKIPMFIVHKKVVHRILLLYTNALLAVSFFERVNESMKCFGRM
ncbi:Prolyl endopeptidase, partial [Geodia barretti]